MTAEAQLAAIIAIEITVVQLVAREYDCRCGETHRYHEGILFELHGDWRIGNDRWVYETLSQSR